ncbi:PKD domain-containing protein [Flammeovirga sp. SubArs3]|uniref:PKD domain-containing protein n=1 Tax=Flammeovirga sp. SubArs3 TaxID=2995316 RepID=UPI00248C9B4A|nr:PKD domain-containing protein [Flammeovirga sp. SubArs3]
MKQNIYSLFSFVILIWMASCTEDAPSLGPNPTADDVSFTATPTAENPNIYEFTNTTPNSIAYWSFGTGASGKGDNVTAEYAVQGDYDVTLLVITADGQAESTKTITIEDTDFSLLDREDYNFLTGGADSINGKNWVFDKMTVGHMGIGPADGDNSDIPVWWGAEPLQKDGLGAYDDVINFNLNGFKYTLTNNGDTYAKDYMADWFTSRGGSLVQDADDHTYSIAFDDQATWAWSISERDGKQYLSVSGDAFLSWHVGGSQEYEIQTLNEDEMYLRTIGDDGNAWYFGFIREGFERPVTPPKEKPLEENDLFDDFAGSTNVTFVTDQALTFTTGFPNIDESTNDATSVGKYERNVASGDEGWWQNYQAELPNRIDLSTRHVFKMKVYFLPSNDFTTVTPAAETPEWLGDVAMTPTVALRLENSLDGEAWRTRAEVAHTIGEDDMGHWVELTFDYSGVMTDANKDWSYSVPAIDNTFYDKVIIQIGGEGHTRPGTFYISDFRLEE